MAPVYDFTHKALTAPHLIRTSDDAIKKALLKAKCPQGQIDAFLKELKGPKGKAVESALRDLCDVVSKKVVGAKAYADLVLHNKTTLANVLKQSIMKPQFLFQVNSFDLSIHLKNGNVQLWMSYKGDGTNVAIDVPATAKG